MALPERLHPTEDSVTIEILSVCSHLTGTKRTPGAHWAEQELSLCFLEIKQIIKKCEASNPFYDVRDVQMSLTLTKKKASSEVARV